MSTPASAPAAAAPAPAQGAAAPAKPGSAPATAPKPGADGKAAPTAAEIRKLKLKIDGQELELPENEVVARAQRETVSTKRFQEAAEMRRQHQEDTALLESNPAEYFKKKGKNFREMAEAFLMEELKREAMTPEQKEAAENARKLKEYEATDKKRKDDERKAQIAELEKEHEQNYTKVFVDALGKSGLPRTQYTVKRMAELQLVNVKKKLELSPDQLAKLVREDYMAEQKALYGALDGDQLLEVFGPDLIKKVSKAQIAKLKAKGSQTLSGGAPKRPQTEENQISWNEWKRQNRGRK